MSKSILLNAIKAKVKAITGAKGSHGEDVKFHFYGLFNDQFNKEDEEDVLSYPAVFASFPVIEWTAKLGNNRNLQEGRVDITLHIGFKVLDKDNSFVLDEVDKVFAALEGYTTEDFDPLRRTTETQDTDYANMLVWELTLSTILRDKTAANLTDIEHVITFLDARTESELVDNLDD